MTESKKCPWKCPRCRTLNTEKKCSVCGRAKPDVTPMQLFCRKDKRIIDRPPYKIGTISKVRDMNAPVEEYFTEPEYLGEVAFQRRVYYQGRGSQNRLEQPFPNKKWSKPAQYEDCEIIENEYGEPIEIRRHNKDFDPTDRKNPKYWFWKVKLSGDLSVSPEGIKEIAEAIRIHESLKQENEKLRIALKAKRTELRNKEIHIAKLSSDEPEWEDALKPVKKRRFSLFKKS